MEKMNKVKIEISKGTYSKSHKDGAEYTSVGYDGKRYGGTSPCDNQEEIDSSIEHAKKTIIKEGDIPILYDLREVQQTL